MHFLLSSFSAFFVPVFCKSVQGLTVRLPTIFTGYSGDLCEVDRDDCAATTCPATATCIDGVNQAFCRCPVGRAAPTCTTGTDADGMLQCFLVLCPCHCVMCVMLQCFLVLCPCHCVMCVMLQCFLVLCPCHCVMCVHVVYHALYENSEKRLAASILKQGLKEHYLFG